MWRCPHCREPLKDTGKAWVCATGHQFDKAREGYVNLQVVNTKSSKQPGDNPEMLSARKRVHEMGLYAPLSTKLAQLLAPLPGQSVLDLGCGEGFYSRDIATGEGVNLLGVDVSKSAVRTAARLSVGGEYAVASSFDLPLDDGSLDGVFRVFAPSEDEEVRRVLKFGGCYIEVTPAARHLWQLRELLYATPRPHEPSRDYIDGFDLTDKVELEYEVELDNAMLHDLVAMTPFAYRGHPERRKHLLAMPKLTVEMAFGLKCFAKPASKWAASKPAV